MTAVSCLQSTGSTGLAKYIAPWSTQSRQLNSDRNNVVSVAFDHYSFERLQALRLIGKAMRLVHAHQAAPLEVPTENLRQFARAIGKKAVPQYVDDTHGQSETSQTALFPQSLSFKVVMALQQNAEYSGLSSTIQCTKQRGYPLLCALDCTR